MHDTVLVVLVLLTLVLGPAIIAAVNRALKLIFLGGAVRTGLKAVGREAVEKQPDSIHLSRRSSYVWQNPSEMQDLARPLLARGFSDIGDFAIAEMPDIALRFLMNSADSVYACIYEHPKLGRWLDLVSRYSDGSTCTFTNTRARGLEHRPQDKVVHAFGSSADELCTRIMRERPKRNFASVDAEGVVRLFEAAYREQIEWRKKKGISATEVASVLAARTR